jgi:hypothetical protein
LRASIQPSAIDAHRQGDERAEQDDFSASQLSDRIGLTMPFGHSMMGQFRTHWR